MILTKGRWLLCVCLVGLALATTGCDPISGPGMLTGTVAYAKDPNWPLSDPQNAGEPAPGVKVIIYATEKQNVGAGPDVYLAQKMPAKEVTTDEEGHYAVELPSGHYVVRLAPDPKLYDRLVDVGPYRATTADFIVLRPGAAPPAPTPTVAPVPTPGGSPSPYPAPGQ